MIFLNKIAIFFLGVVPEIVMPTGVWEKIIIAFNNGIHSYAWAIIVFTLALKIVMLPLDFFNKKMTVKNAKIQAVIKPEMEKLQKQYGNNKQVLNQKMMELYKKNNYNVGGSFLVMLVNLGLTLFIFISLFSGLNSMASYKVGYQYQEMEKVYTSYVESTNYDDYLAKYTSVYNTVINSYITGDETIDDVTAEEKQDAINQAIAEAETLVGNTEEQMLEEINSAVLVKYNEVKNSWLWISNVWKSDTPWTKSVTTFDEFVSMAGITYKDDVTAEQETFKIRPSANKDADRKQYENVMLSIESENVVNGYLIIPILSVASTILSLLASQGKLRFGKKKKNIDTPQAPGGGWIMAIFLGGLMGYITISYNTIFALYILVGSLFGLATTPLMNLLIKKIDKSQEDKKQKKLASVDYKRK